MERKYSTLENPRARKSQSMDACAPLPVPQYDVSGASGGPPKAGHDPRMDLESFEPRDFQNSAQNNQRSSGKNKKNGDDDCMPQEEVEDYLLPYLTGEKEIAYTMSVKLREPNVPESDIRLAILTQFAAPPPLMFTQGKSISRTTGPFWDKPIVATTTEFDSREMHAQLEATIRSEFIRDVPLPREYWKRDN
ncbi:hypothetical protein TCAL_02899 [Tigriopus californicus]|uniref:Uncharacterized protein n=1 Tax=Tigriopus californicus TaxID=6832 RepID=A0A553P076_TIGCA|nr:uncharacterized protein LOC131886382 isoform X2 [Tigriopus californicus]TRY71090.1 hypothetical protein TCAL_02899 [Tigriopus californicus]|eukprot:TCALIF_02899-PA protein Name:"Protein of unknown function" AED:0.00 eAED:0.00 QI:263/1/1/1/1/1/2/81/191